MSFASKVELYNHEKVYKTIKFNNHNEKICETWHYMPNSTSARIQYTPKIISGIKCSEAIYWYNKDGKLHNTNGPAVIGFVKNEPVVCMFYQNGKLEKTIVW